TKIKISVVSRCASASDHHARVVAYEDRSGKRVAPGVFEDNSWIAPLAKYLPELLSEGANAAQPGGKRLRIFKVRHASPMTEFSTVDHSRSPELFAVFDVRFRRNDSDGNAP